MTSNLGFCESISAANVWRLDRTFFPSKVGGLPVWLVPDVQNIPTCCDQCKSKLRFLMQIYSPGSGESAFHRTIFVFVCSSKNFCQAPPVIFRQQLMQNNKYYPSEAPNYEVRNLKLSIKSIKLLVIAKYNLPD